MDRWMDRYMEEWMYGWTDRWMDERRQMESGCTISYFYCHFKEVSNTYRKTNITSFIIPSSFYSTHSSVIRHGIRILYLLYNKLYTLAIMFIVFVFLDFRKASTA